MSKTMIINTITRQPPTERIRAHLPRKRRRKKLVVQKSCPEEPFSPEQIVSIILFDPS